MDFGFGREARLQEETDPVNRVLSKPTEQRSWRMQQAVIAEEHTKKCMDKCRSSDAETKLHGLAHAMLARFHAVGYQKFTLDLPAKVVGVVSELRSNPEYSTRIPKGNGREVVASSMRPGPYILLIAAEAFALWLNVKSLEAMGGRSPAELQAAYAMVEERVLGALIKLSGNMASTVLDAQGRMNQAATTAAVSMVPVGDGMSAPADVIIAAQLAEYGIHPKQLAWVLQELRVDMAKGPALQHNHQPSLKAMAQGADAMVLLASSPEALPQHPSSNLSAAADAAVRAVVARLAAGSSDAGSRAAAAGGSSGSSSTRQALVEDLLPPPGTLSDEMIPQLTRGHSVAALRRWLETEGVDYRQCIEKEDLVQLVVRTYRSDAYKARRQQRATVAIEDRPPPDDMTHWLHMALFLKAEAGEARMGRPVQVVSTYTAAAELALQHDDEMYGCLCCWNACKAVMDGGQPYTIGELLRWLDAAYSCKKKLDGWSAYTFVEPRIKVLQGMKQDIKKYADQQRRARRGGRSSSSRPSTFTYSDIRNDQVKALVQPGDEHTEFVPHPINASARSNAGVVLGQQSKGKPCANCKQLFHARMTCSACKSIWYCGKDCQAKHWHVAPGAYLESRLC